MKTETKAKFTRGPWTVEVYNPQHGSTRSRQIELWGELSSGGPARIATMETDAVENGRDYADACLMAYAGTAATQLEDAGYDGLEALRALSEIVGTLTTVNNFFAANSWEGRK